MLPTNLVVIDMKEFDVILGMDWLTTYETTIDCFSWIQQKLPQVR